MAASEGGWRNEIGLATPDKLKLILMRARWVTRSERFASICEHIHFPPVVFVFGKGLSSWMGRFGGEICGPIKIQTAAQQHRGLLHAGQGDPYNGWTRVNRRRLVLVVSVAFQLVVDRFH